MPLRAPPATVAAAFAAITIPNLIDNPTMHRTMLHEFIEEWFDPVESDLVAPYGPGGVTLPQPPAWMDALTPPEAQRWARHLHATWGSLCRAASPSVAENPERHTLLPVPRPFIIPGARFRESYYWDSYWIVQGLLASELVNMARDVVHNLLHVARTHGFVPNGLRSYYLNRSQPPLLACMVETLWTATKDKQTVRDALPVLVAEQEWWAQEPRCVRVVAPDGSVHAATRYFAAWDQPRPESLREDLETAGVDLHNVHTPPDAHQRSVYRDLASAAESGWDFSSRLFADGNRLATVRTTQIVPVDLNALLLRAATSIVTLAYAVGESEIASRFERLAEQRRSSLAALHWRSEDGRWGDLVITPAPGRENNLWQGNASEPTIEYASDWIPLWCGAVAVGSPEAQHAVASLLASGLVQQGGVAASNFESEQQWDWPNAWPPLQSMLAEGCDQYGGQAGKELAGRIRASFLGSAHAAWRDTGRMFEKFNALNLGAPGGGGEYEVVDGFGWTNGLALAWMKEYGAQGLGPKE